jgi:hypothetical protein
MTIRPHTVWKFLHYERTDLARPLEWIDLAASKAMQMHAEEIEVARRFWACPFQSLSIGGRAVMQWQSRSAGTNVPPPAHG